MGKKKPVQEKQQKEPEKVENKKQELNQFLDELLATKDEELSVTIFNRKKELCDCMYFMQQNDGRYELFTKIMKIFSKDCIINNPIIDNKEKYIELFFKRDKFMLDCVLKNLIQEMLLKGDYDNYPHFLECLACQNISNTNLILNTLKKSVDIIEDYPGFDQLKRDLQSLEEKLKQFLEEENKRKNLIKNFEIYPTAEDLQLKRMDFSNNAMIGFKDMKELKDTLQFLEKLNFILPVIEALGKPKKDVRDIFIYHNVHLENFTDNKILTHEMFLHFEIFAYEYWDKVLVNISQTKRLANQSMLFLSQSPDFKTIDAICRSEMPSKIHKLATAEFQELFKQNRVPVSLIKGEIIPGRNYYMIESINSWIPTEIRLNAFNQINESSFPYFRDIILKSKVSDLPTYDDVITVKPWCLIKEEDYKDSKFDKNEELKVNDINLKELCKGIPVEHEDYEHELIDFCLTVDQEQYYPMINFFLKPITIANGCAGAGKSYLAVQTVKLFYTSKVKEPLFIITQTKHTVNEITKSLLKFVDTQDILKHSAISKDTDKEIQAVEFNNTMFEQSSYNNIYRSINNSYRASLLNLQIFNNIICSIHELGVLIKHQLRNKNEDHIQGICMNFIACIKQFIHFKRFKEYFDSSEKITCKMEDFDYVRLWIDPDYYSKMKKKYNLFQNTDEIDNDIPEEKSLYSDDLFTEMNSNPSNNTKIISTSETFTELNADFDEDEDGISIDELTGEEFAYTKRSKKYEELGEFRRKADVRLDSFNRYLFGIMHNEPCSTRLEDMYMFVRYILKNIIEWRDEFKLEVDDKSKQLAEIKAEIVGDIYLKKRIVVMTASYASRFKKSIEKANCKYMIIEEAGELTEAMTISILPNTLQHLMLVGDYQQIRPAVHYNLTYQQNKAFSFDISTFERLILNILQTGKDKNQNLFFLYRQRRMHPDISLPNKELFCKEMDNGDQKPPEGYKLEKRVSFFKHNYEETMSNETRSKGNEEEAMLAVYCAFFFLHRGFDQSQITILTYYRGQEALIKKKLLEQYKNRKSDFDVFDPFNGEDPNINVKCVDNFQGEENDVIILSLTRSTPSDFIKNENRMYVAASRAKAYFVVLANSKLLDPNNPKNGKWPQYFEIMKKNSKLNNFGEGIPIKAEKKIVFLKDSVKLYDNRYDYSQVSKKDCKFKMKCGHICPMKFNHADNIHDHIICKENCLHECEHCGERCKEECHGCKHICHKIHTKHFDECGHDCEFECWRLHDKNNPPKCYQICGKTCTFHSMPCILQCGHEKEKEILLHKCDHEDETECPVCLKTIKTKCGEKPFCTNPCSAILECGHKCRGVCGYCTEQGHMECEEKCSYKYPCGHNCNKMCKDHSESHNHKICHECEMIKKAKKDLKNLKFRVWTPPESPPPNENKQENKDKIPGIIIDSDSDVQKSKVENVSSAQKSKTEDESHTQKSKIERPKIENESRAQKLKTEDESQALKPKIENESRAQKSKIEIPNIQKPEMSIFTQSPTEEQQKTQYPKLEEKCDQKCPAKNCRKECLCLKGEQCVFNCVHNMTKRQPFHLKNDFYFRFTPCNHFVKFSKAKIHVQEEFEKIMNVNLKDNETPNPLRQISCPVCKADGISKSNYFKEEYTKINEKIEKKEKLIQSDKYPQNHDLRPYVCPCGNVIIHDMANGNETKCIKCKRSFSFDK